VQFAQFSGGIRGAARYAFGRVRTSAALKRHCARDFLDSSDKLLKRHSLHWSALHTLSRCQVYATKKAAPFAARRESLKAITVDYDRGELVLAWKHDGEMRVQYDYSREFVSSAA